MPPTRPLRHVVIALAVITAAMIALLTLGPQPAIEAARITLTNGLNTVGAPFSVSVGTGGVEAVSNALMFVPVGVLPVLLAGRRARRRVVALSGAGAALLGFELSAAIELAQAWLPGRVPDADDLAANTVGAAVGAVLAVGGVLAVRGRRATVGRRGTFVAARGGASARPSAGIRPRRARRAGVIAAVLTSALLVGTTACAVEVRSSRDAPAGAPGLAAASGLPGIDDGYVEEGESISPFADELPAIAKLDPALRAAMQEAARAALDDGVDFVVTSGWRSAVYQQWLFDDAVREYGDVDAASAFVATPETSAHVTGDAVDIGRTDANSWLSQHGADYGLCQTYANEMWHFELATEPGGECPAQLPDASAG